MIAPVTRFAPSPTGLLHLGHAHAALFAEPVYFDITAELCSESDLVLAHMSTGLSYAVLWKKPIIILTSKSLDESYYGTAIKEWSIQLHCPLLFMESDDNQYGAVRKRSREVNVEAYQRYIDNFITNDEVAEDAPWQAFTNFVNGATNQVTR